MQRIISLEASRSSNLTSEFVTKRLCCSFILTVAFFAVIGGFFLGRFATDKTLERVKMDIAEISKKLTALDRNLKNTFLGNLSNTNCTAIASRVRCPLLDSGDEVPQESSTTSILRLLDTLNTCFSYG